MIFKQYLYNCSNCQKHMNIAIDLLIIRLILIHGLKIFIWAHLLKSLCKTFFFNFLTYIKCELFWSNLVFSRIRSEKMKNSLVIITFIFIFFSSCSSELEDVLKKYCDPSIPSVKIDELSKCETAVLPEEVRKFFDSILLIKKFFLIF